MAIASETAHSPVVYLMAVVKNSTNAQAARQMLQFLSTPEAQAVFKRHGFTPIDNSNK